MTRLRRAADPDYRSIYEAASEWRDGPLRTGRSLFEPDRDVWTAPVAEDIYNRFVENADHGDGTFAEKLHEQLEGAGQDSHLLMAELMFIHLLPLINVGLEAKLRNIDTIGSWAPQPFTTPPRFHDPLSKGIFNGGAGYNTRRHQYVSFLIQFTRTWAALNGQTKSDALADPWAFKDLLHERSSDGVDAQRNALLLMLFPDTFEDISAREHKKRIVAAFPQLAGDSSDIDRQLLAIRSAKSADFGADFSWYKPEIRNQWDSKASSAKGKAETRKYASVADELEAILPEVSDRRLFADTAAKAIIAANDVNPLSWSLSFRDRGVHLNIGPNRMLSIQPGVFGISVQDDTGAIQQAAQAAGVDITIGTAFSFPDQTRHLSTSPEQATQTIEAFAGSFIRATTACAVQNTRYWRSHSPEALEVVARLAEAELPDIPERDATEDDKNRRAWIVRVKRDGVRDVAASIENGDTRVFWPIDIPAGSEIEVIKDALRSADPDASAYLIGNQAGNLHRFITRIQLGDLLLMPDGSDLYLGTVTGDAVYDPDTATWSRSVDWANTEAPLDRSDVSDALFSRLRTLLTVTEITDLRAELDATMGAADPEAEVPVVPARTKDLVELRAVDSDLARDWLLDRDWLNEIINLLRRKKQVIFYGPPGTGKTWVAEKLAEHMTSDGGNYRIVQFHPSYSYEDFVEGFRPKSDNDGNLGYVLTPGPLKLLADAAREEPTVPHILIIDEINRGNLAKIFGELYYLLEYREQSLVLQYGSGTGDEFSLPHNLFVIGTMNTADRSIAVVDAAIRRRFYFVEFNPTSAPIDRLLSRWLTYKTYPTDAADLLAELNRRLGDDDYAIGPSYLMNDDVVTDAGLERIWKYSIMPLLDEHFYGQPGAAGRLSLRALRRALSNSVDAHSPIVESDDALPGDA